ncbi:AraC family transcriptional regulator ligand-binding domain-containing protein [Nocardia sp. NPDC050712]|uniref:AraC family transcriptional regulator ligand-binding domain-containing protein n=1 Tax=Nocardia sp. NPDC050712 TaxID=3155518 RepID=UPI0033E21561
MIEGTVPIQLIRLIHTAALHAGVAPAELAHLRGLDPALLADDLIRVPVATPFRIWELIEAHAGPEAGLRVSAAAALGSLQVWDYLFTTGQTLREGLAAASDFHATITDPAVGLSVLDDGRLLTVRYTGIEPEAAIGATNEFAISLLLRRIREATGRPMTPVRVRLGHPPRGRYRHLVDAFGTSRIDFDAPHSELTFLDAAELPTGNDPHLGHLIRSHAGLTLDSAKTIPGWPDLFRAAMADALTRDELGLDAVAQRLAMSARTLQRRLGEHGTSWRAEVEAARLAKATALLRDTALPVGSVATRLGYADARALRRAFQRWTGQTPAEFRARSTG